MLSNQDKKNRKEPFRYKPGEDLVLRKESSFKLPWKADHGKTSKLWQDIASVFKEKLSDERKFIAPNATSCINFLSLKLEWNVAYFCLLY
jgi:hypothetical protein